MKDNKKGTPGLLRTVLAVSVVVSLVITIGWHFLVF